METARLKANQISPIGLAALAIGIMSPALGLFALWGPMQAAAGPITPLVFLASAALALPTALSYARLNAEAASAGAASTWLWSAISPASGYLIGLAMSAYFIFAAIAQPLLFGLFFRDLITLCGVQASDLWALLIAVPTITVPVLIVAYRGAEASTRLTVALMMIESAVVVALSLTILGTKGSIPGGINAQPLNPLSATHGFRGFWTAMLLGTLAFCGFDVVSTAAEEARAPREHLPKAIVLTIVGITVFWALNAWAFTLAMPNEVVVRYAAEGSTGVMPLAGRYWGWGKLLVILTSITGVCAVYVTSAVGASRILFALARHRLLPTALAHLHGVRRVPRNALHVVFAVVVVGDAIALLALRNGLAAFNWWANALVFFATFTFAAVNIANIAYFHSVVPQRRHYLWNFCIPLTGVISTAYVMYEMFFVALWSSDFAKGRSVVYFSLLLMAVFVAAVAIVARVAPGRLAGAAPIQAYGENI